MAWQPALKPSGTRGGPRIGDEHRVRSIADRHGPTHVVLSFGARDGGATFAQWLRLEIMRAKGWSQPNNVYLDTIGLAAVPGTSLSMRQVGPGTGGLCSLNDGWNAYYRHAMRQAGHMIFVLTAAWQRSPNCAGELRDFHQENLRRRGAGEPPLRAIALGFADGGITPFPGDAILIPAQQRHAVAAAAARARLGGMYRDFWTLDPASLSRLLAALG